MSITHVRGRWNAETQTVEDGVMETTWEGRVVRVFRREYQAMSDVYTIATYATIVHDDGSVHDILVNANFECDISQGEAQVDATPWALEMWGVHLTRIKEAQIARDAAERQAREEEARNRAVKGKRMVVFKGRKVPVGTLGTVAYVSDSGRALLKNDEEWEVRTAQGVWVDVRNLRARE